MPVVQKQNRTRPILFSAPMVRALLAGKKTQTRRIVKPPRDHVLACCGDPETADFYFIHKDEVGEPEPCGDPTPAIKRCPYGAPGDRLWVRETWSIDARSVYPCDPVLYRADVAAYPYSNDDPANAEHIRDCNGNQADCYACLRERRGFKWKPSIFMRPEHSRITLEVTGVRVERLHEITEEDAAAEGVKRDTSPCDHARQSCKGVGCLGPTFKASYGELWCVINGAKSWEANPWVWVVAFKRVRP